MTAALPEGIVTFLFTDIEGSTRLASETGDVAYADTLAMHRALVGRDSKQAISRAADCEPIRQRFHTTTQRGTDA